MPHLGTNRYREGLVPTIRFHGDAGAVDQPTTTPTRYYCCCQYLLLFRTHRRRLINGDREVSSGEFGSIARRFDRSWGSETYVRSHRSANVLRLAPQILR